jgi:WD40 repeat protein
MATSDNQNQLSIYSMWPPRKEHSFYYKSRVNCFSFAKNYDHIAAAYDDRSIKVWDINRKNSSAASFTCSRTCTALDYPISDSFLVTGHQDGKIRLWDLNNRKVMLESGKAQIEAITGV